MAPPGKILVVDDEIDTRTTLKDILQLEGYQVTTAANGEEALQKVAQNEYDVMILDIVMPKMDGLTVLKRLSNLPVDVEIILLTAHSSVSSAVAALRHGAADYLLKPAAPHEIINTVEKAFQRRLQRRKQQRLLTQLEQSLQALKSESIPGGGAPPETSAVHIIPLTPNAWVDMTRRHIRYGTETISLTPTEGRLLHVFLEHEGEVLEHQRLVKMAQGYEVASWEAPDVLRPLISRLRSKLKRIPGGWHWIANVRGVGYVFERPK